MVFARLNMACELRLPSRGSARDFFVFFCFFLLAGRVSAGQPGHEPTHDASRYHYTVPLAVGQTPKEFGRPHFMLLEGEDDQILFRSRRDDQEKTVVTTEQTVVQESQTQETVSQAPQQQPAQTTTLPTVQHPPQTVLNISNTSANVSYSTDNGATEVQDQPNNNGQPKKPTTAKANPAIVSQSANSSADGEKVKMTVTTEKSIETTSQKVTESASSTEPSIDDSDESTADIGDISISKFSNFTKETLSHHNITKAVYDTHQYYNSTFIINEAIAKRYWVDIDSRPERIINNLLSHSYRRAATVKLKFDFPFYGHKVRNITMATGGFLYTGEYVHSWLAATQYIAPLMANFDTRLSKNSQVKYSDNGTAFTVEWKRVVLQDRPDAGEFTFQVTLHQNGDIVFVYSSIPLLVEDIKDTLHPVKVGLSDAYIMDRIVYTFRRKTIYEYHRVNFNQQDIQNWTVIYLQALPTCLQMDNCNDCLTKLKDFECKWCAELNRCSTGTFRARQDWLLKGCDAKQIKVVANCPDPTTTYKEHEEGYEHDKHYSEDTVISEVSVKQERTGGSSPPLERTRESMTMGVSGIIGILLVIALVFGLVAWAAYAYRNPHSASGQMLIRYRPSQWSWRRGEARYTAATIHM